jgi:hypothetical protein
MNTAELIESFAEFAKIKNRQTNYDQNSGRRFQSYDS